MEVEKWHLVQLVILSDDKLNEGRFIVDLDSILEDMGIAKHPFVLPN